MMQKQKNKLELLLENVGDMALKRRGRKIIENLEHKVGDKILDVGCGDGFYLYLLSNLDIRMSLTGCDLDPIALTSAKKNLKNKKIRFFTADLMKKLPFKNNTFDKIVMSEVAEHLPSDVKGLKEIYRILKPGGIVCLSVPNANYPFLWDPINWIMERIMKKHVKEGFWAGIWNQHIRLYKPLEISAAVEKAGLTVEKVESITWWCLPFNHNLINMVARLLYRENPNKELVAAVSKYEVNNKKPIYIKFLFDLVNFNDKINNIISFKNIGQGIFVKATKKQTLSSRHYNDL